MIQFTEKGCVPTGQIDDSIKVWLGSSSIIIVDVFISPRVKEQLHTPGRPRFPSHPGGPRFPRFPHGPCSPGGPRSPSVPFGPGGPGSPLFPLEPLQILLLFRPQVISIQSLDMCVDMQGAPSLPSAPLLPLHNRASVGPHVNRLQAVPGTFERIHEVQLQVPLFVAFKQIIETVLPQVISAQEALMALVTQGKVQLHVPSRPGTPGIPGGPGRPSQVISEVLAQVMLTQVEFMRIVLQLLLQVQLVQAQFLHLQSSFRQ